jgi:hypothetical protein
LDKSAEVALVESAVWVGWKAKLSSFPMVNRKLPGFKVYPNVVLGAKIKVGSNTTSRVFGTNGFSPLSRRMHSADKTKMSGKRM